MSSTLFHRLMEIAALEGLPRKNKSIEALLKVTSGRVTQIKQEGSTASLSEEKMALLTARGYSRDWIAFGKPPMRVQDASVPPLPAALPVVLDTLAACENKQELKTVLALVVDTNAPLYRQRLAELLQADAKPPRLPVESKEFHPPVPAPNKTKA